MFYILNTENIYFKRFKKGDKLLNNILVHIKSDNKIYIVFSSSHSNTLKVCKVTYEKTKITPISIAKFENVLKSFTWTLTGSNLKTTDNGISYTLEAILRKNNISIKPIFQKPKNIKSVENYTKISNLLINSENNKSA